ncbi:MAG TPA: HD domain-containing protein, partial [Methylomirabilota bacterium]|nr:HD domain-containing protein [Methylomirabilota bacterium]
MAGNKGFRNLPKLARLKRGVSLPSTQRPSVSLPPRRKLPPSGETLRLEAFPPPLREFLRTLEALSRGQEIFLTGGLVRDAMLRRDEIVDADLVTQSDAVSVARKIADAFGGACFMLDEQRGTARALLTLGATSAQVDVANFRASTLEADLRARDFTINALAVELKPLIQRGRGVIVDPTGGLADLRRHRLRLCGPRSLHDDPLRALRAVRLSHQLQCSLETRTRAAVQRAAPSLGRVAWERIRDECLMILALSDSAAALRDLDRLGLLRVIIPEIEAMKGTRQPAPHRFTVWEHSLRTVASLDALLADLSLLALYSDDLAGHLREALGSAASRAQVLKLAGLLHDVAKPETRAEVDGRVRFIGHDTRGAEIAGDVAERLRLPTKATRTLAQLVRHHLRPMHLGQLESISRRARYRFAR